jgi:hypothetical protein
LTGLLFTSRRAVADVLDLGAEAAVALTTITAAALGALLPPSGATTHAIPDPADSYLGPTGRGTVSRLRERRLRVLPDPPPDPRPSR